MKFMIVSRDALKVQQKFKIHSWEKLLGNHKQKEIQSQEETCEKLYLTA